MTKINSEPNNPKKFFFITLGDQSIIRVDNDQGYVALICV